MFQELCQDPVVTGMPTPGRKAVIAPPAHLDTFLDESQELDWISGLTIHEPQLIIL